jgi:hypothetical protein
MKRFKDSKEINNIVIAAGSGQKTKIPKSPGFLEKPSLFYWDTKFKSLGLDATGAPILDPKAVERIESAIKAVKGKAGLDEQITQGVNILGGVTGAGIGIAKILASQSAEWQYMVPALAAATILSGLYLKLKPLDRARLIRKIPHIEDTLVNIQSKKYKVEETIGNKNPIITEYTLPQILSQLNSAGTFEGGVWVTGKASRKFADSTDVDKINHMLQHQHLSEIRDAVASVSAVPAALVTTALGYGGGMAIQNEREKARIKEYQKATKDIKVTAPPPATKSEITEGMVRVPGKGYQRYTDIREKSDGSYEYYVPVIKAWVKEGN